MDIKAVGNQIAALRKGKSMTQSELGERLGITFQAVSKWERGETLPDTVLLPDLANILETSVDYILSGGQMRTHYNGKITVSQMEEGLNCLKKMGEHLGKEHILYRHAIEGINSKMNTSIEEAFVDEHIFECFLTEVIIQSLMSGKYIDKTDVQNNIRSPHFKGILLQYCDRYGIL